MVVATGGLLCYLPDPLCSFFAALYYAVEELCGEFMVLCI